MTDDRLDRMGAFDAVMWGIEGDPQLRSVIVAMVVVDDEPDVDVLIDRITRMTIDVPKLRSRVVGNQAVSLIPPRWEIDPNFDLSFHLNRYHVPPDGTDRPLMRIAEQMGESDFDRSRPLWEMALVQGWDGKRSAVIIKLHHAVTDGVGGMAMAASLFDLVRDGGGDPGPLPKAPSGEPLGVQERWVNGAQFLAKQVVRRGQSAAETTINLVTRAVSDPGATAVAAQEFAQSAGRLLAPADVPLSPLMTGRSLSVQMAVVQVPFLGLRASAKAAGGTINDSFMAAVSGAMATYHEAHGTPAEAVRVNMPINTRSSGDAGGGNRWVPARFALPVDGGDPAKRIRRLGPLLKQARTEPALVVSDTVYRLLTALPQAATTSVSAGMMKGCDLACTNVPGPPIPLYSAGTAVEAIVPLAPKAGAAVNIGLMTYNGVCYVGLNIDTRAVPDADDFVEHVRAAFDDILAIADPSLHATIGLHSGKAPTSGVVKRRTRTQIAGDTAPTARKAPAKKAPAKKATSGASATKAPAKKAPAKKATSESSATKAAAKKAPAKKASTAAAPA